MRQGRTSVKEGGRSVTDLAEALPSTLERGSTQQEQRATFDKQRRRERA
jgi:hypothetical protein